MRVEERAGQALLQERNTLMNQVVGLALSSPTSSTEAIYDFNTFTLAEMAGEKRAQRIIQVQRKYFTRTSRMFFKSPVEHLWRDQITQVVLDARRQHHEEPSAEVTSRG
ncbi:hypothetical protein ANCCAN_08906 [Ancylostoma caninum]|uniref:Uncharacterized protein n=1 Tax=Ancylostoma caninum TaxID=29170 RepID=A0A368GL52_ANCCA|nr:hypothetical protein ANCCAN_08906 [Ancylostoma caninum]